MAIACNDSKSTCVFVLNPVQYNDLGQDHISAMLLQVYGRLTEND